MLILKESIDKYNIDKIPFCIACPKKDINILKQKLLNNKENYDLLFFTDEEVLNIIDGDNEQSWATQQVVKLNFYKIGICKNYLMLDSDCYFIQNFEVSDFLYDENTMHLPIMGGIKKGKKYEKSMIASFKTIQS